MHQLNSHKFSIRERSNRATRCFSLELTKKNLQTTHDTRMNERMSRWGSERREEMRGVRGKERNQRRGSRLVERRRGTRFRRDEETNENQRRCRLNLW